MPTANITLVVNDSTNSSCLGIAQPTIGSGGGGQRVRLRNNSSTDTAIIVKGKGSSSLDLAFTVTGYTMNGASPMTITGTNAATNFSNQVVSADKTTVTITDIFGNTGPAGGTLPAWTYTISVKNSAGVICTIDPVIENEAEN
jgi:hypothetical protein